MEVEAPRVAKHCLPGQFVIVKMDEEGERIPLTICDYSGKKVRYTIVFQPIGESTMRMAELKEGDAFMEFRRSSGTAVGILQGRSGRADCQAEGASGKEL